ncbi:chemotaxis response regulator protein-glutamate methylesterase [bacterium]|nr:chemotaxis response regulator protein-glutamate methylesterase [bacterium]MBU1650976.1 chemotaxis response regulator protein-glutamate methylesterase [bacterium]MBU1880908.1 chemotaxis response regulator protein-glutamate methylesterase [bacterium]
MSKKTRVLIVDDSAMVRMILSKGLSQDPEIEVIGTAADPEIALRKLSQSKPDVMTLDVEMAKMDGVEFLRRLMPRFPIPVLMVSSLTERGGEITLDALDAGAVDFVTKPNIDIAYGLNEMLDDLRIKVKAVAKVDVSNYRKKCQQITKPIPRAAKVLAKSTDKVIAIGASTGGTEAIRQVITQFPASTPGVVIVQHMPPGFTQMFADRLNDQSEMEVREAQNGDRVLVGRALIAPGDFHMKVKRIGGEYRVVCAKGEKVNGHRPSVEVLFDSVAEHVGSNAVGVVLTGMGGDGGQALLRMRQAGARTLAQDEATSVVFGMPKVAYECGGAERLIPIHSMSKSVLGLLTRKD